MMNFNKKDVVEKMREIGIDGVRVTKRDCEQYLDLSLEAIIETLAQGADAEPNPRSNVRSKLTMVGFGTFDIVVTSPRRVHNPKKPDERHILPPRNRVRFSSGKLLNDHTERVLAAQ